MASTYTREDSYNAAVSLISRVRYTGGASVRPLFVDVTPPR
jgi:hypothetical protein